MAKYIFVTGGVVSSLGKGLIAASLGRLLKNRGLKVNIQKFDPYLNVDPGTMSPYQHGEVYVTEDGAETDLDLGHYERFIDINLNAYSSVTAGKIYNEVLQNERQGVYEGATVQVIPHVTNAIKDKLFRASQTTQADVVITEIGGTVGDIEGLPFIEAIRQVRSDVGSENVMYIHVTLVPYLHTSSELKTKPTQHSVKELRSYGIQPNLLVVRTEKGLPDSIKDKLALFCDVDPAAVIESRDVETLYTLPLSLQAQRMDQLVCDHFGFQVPEADMSAWQALEDRVLNLHQQVTIGLVGKYVSLPDAYLSVAEALAHAGYHHDAAVQIRWIDSEGITPDNVADQLQGLDGIIVPGGFGSRGVSGMIESIRYAREAQVPFLGVCFGLQLALVEFARNVLGLSQAHSTEIDSETPDPVVHIMADQKDVQTLGGTLRLGAFETQLKPGSKAQGLYGCDQVKERHRHRYEVNSTYREAFEAAGMEVTGVSADGDLIEVIELAHHPFFVASQFHPEFTSRPNRPNPLFRGFIQASLAQAQADGQ